MALSISGPVTPASAAHRRFYICAEVGRGSSDVRPLVLETVAVVAAAGGLGLRLSERASLALQVAATAGEDAGEGIPERSSGGKRSLTSFLVGVEVCPLAGAFAFVGIGAGHSSLSGAREGISGPPDWGVPSRSLSGLALGAGARYRFEGGPGPLGFQVALRMHALIDSGEIPSSAYALMVGLGY